MKAGDQLSDFIRSALLAGKQPETIREALVLAGWQASTADAALADWVVVPDLPPVPRPRPYVSAREAMLFGLMFLSLASITWNSCILGFELIDRLFPDGTMYRPYPGNLRWAMAGLLIFGPMFALLDRYLNRRRRAAGQRGTGQPLGGRSLVRRWIAAITLLLAAMLLLGDLVVSVYTLLQGEMTLRFILKSALVALMAGLILLYYWEEMDG